MDTSHRRLGRPCNSVGLALLLLLAAPAKGQLNFAYDEGFKYVREMMPAVKELVDSDQKRQDFNAVKDLGARLVARLDKVIEGVDAMGKNMKDADNKGWAATQRWQLITAAKNAREKADALRAKGDAKQDCKAQAVELQGAYADLFERMKKSWEEHERRLEQLDSKLAESRAKYMEHTVEDRRPIMNLTTKADELSAKCEKLNEDLKKASAASKAAGEECDKAREEVRRNPKATDSELDRLHENLKKSEARVLQIGQIWMATRRELDAANAAHGEIYKELQKAWETYNKEVVEGDHLFTMMVKEPQRRAAEMGLEYKKFSF